jgi:hypothetical protein
VTVRPAVARLAEIRVVSGAAVLRPGTTTPADTICCAAIRQNTGDVLLEAVLEYRGSGPRRVPSSLTWGGGIPVTDNPLRRTVSRSAWGKFPVSCSLDGVSRTVIVYIIGAEPTGYQGDGGTSYPDNDKAVTPLGIQPCDPGTGRYSDQCQIQFTVRPLELIRDGNAGLFNMDDVEWDVSREKLARYWRREPDATGALVWNLYDDRGASWASDDSHDQDEDNNPWDANGHLYGNDTPADTPRAAAVAYVKKLRMREWVRVNIGGGIGRNGRICSGYQYWHVFRSLVRTGGTWRHSPQFGGNEIIAGDPGWGPSPT